MESIKEFNTDIFKLSTITGRWSLLARRRITTR